MKINNVDILTPSKMTVIVSDIDGESGRNAKGELVRDRLTTKQRLDLEWQGLTTDQISSILSKITDSFFTVSYMNPLTGTVDTKTMYVGDRTAPVYNETLGIWEELSLAFIER